jgi:acyl-CoA thioester hydrolase
MGHSLLTGYPVVIQLPVQWGEMDAYGHVNNTVFFRYFESARMAYLHCCGLLESHTKNGIGAILHSTQCRFRHPLFHPDSVEIGARCTELLEDRFTLQYAVVSLSNGSLAAEGSSVIVTFDYKSRTKAAVPDAVRKEIQRLEKKM